MDNNSTRKEQVGGGGSGGSGVGLPEFLQEEIVELMGQHPNVENAKSAQQNVWILRFERGEEVTEDEDTQKPPSLSLDVVADLGTDDGSSITSSSCKCSSILCSSRKICDRSRNKIVSSEMTNPMTRREKDSFPTCSLPCWKQALREGQNHLVVRLWKGSSRWWNLNDREDSVEALARSEAAAYRIARRALLSSSSSEDREHEMMMTSRRRRRIPPALLHFASPVAPRRVTKTAVSSGGGTESLGSINQEPSGIESSPPPHPQQAAPPRRQEFPWAILSYVGPHHAVYDENHRDGGDDGGFPSGPYRGWVDGMVKFRHEFGFLEPHPRWGRVPVEDCLEYALTVLRSVMIPIHRYSRDHCSTIDWSDLTPSPPKRGLTVQPRTTPERYQSSGSVCHNADRYTKKDVVVSAGITFQDMVAVFRRANDDRLVVVEQVDPVLRRFIHRLDSCIRYLESGKDTIRMQSLSPPVLCHMDYQPQNLIHYSRDAIASVLDWEEACYADARFDLLLLCRKVCANREQANIIWRAYEAEGFRNDCSSIATEHLPPPKQQEEQQFLGPIEPWLQLETVHSLTTLLLQSVNLGGRSPWETKPDLLGKVEREFARLAALGFRFSDDMKAR